MGVTPNFEFFVPDPSAVPSRESWVEDPITSVDTQLAALLTSMGLLGQKIKYDVATISGTAVASGAAVSMAVPFGTTFGGTPRVFVALASGVGGSNYLVPRSAGVTTPTGFNLYVYNVGTAAATWTNLAVLWFAIGPA